LLRRVKWAEIAAVLLVGINMMLLGLPGALFLEPVEGLFASFGRKLPPDSAWPMAIYVSMLMPIGFLLAIMVAARARPQASTAELILCGLLGLAVAGFAFSFLLLVVST
jgi:hypothetical protein